MIESILDPTIYQTAQRIEAEVETPHGLRILVLFVWITGPHPYCWLAQNPPES